MRYTVSCAIFVTSIVFSQTARAGMQGVTTTKRDCGYPFLPHEESQLTRAGWKCTREDAAAAKRMKARGFTARQYVDAYREFHEIPRLEPSEVETVAVLQLVDITPAYYFMIDKPYRPSLTNYYNRKLCRRGHILTFTGYSLAVVGAVLTGLGSWMIATAPDPALQENHGATAIAVTGTVALFTGMSMGSIGVHKLRLISRENILETGSMETLRKRRTKTHHFAPDDLYEYQTAPENRRIIGVAPSASPGFVGISGIVTF